MLQRIVLDLFRIRTFSTTYDPRSNGFTFIRMILAALVLVSHSFVLGGFGTEPFHEYTRGVDTLGFLAVYGFFSLSGFLIVASMLHTGSVRYFLWKRALRIMPGYWVCHLATFAFFVPLICLIEGREVSAFFSENSLNLATYFWDNLYLRINVYKIQPLLEGIAYPGVLNGSLWSLIYEWHCYITVALLGLFSLTRVYKWLVLMVTLDLCFGLFPFLGPLLPIWFKDPLFLRVAPYFFVGGTMYLFMSWVVDHPLLFLVSVVTFFIGLRHESFHGFCPIALSYSLIWLGVHLPKFVSRVDEFGDISYGLYVYAFPVQQVLSLVGAEKTGLFGFVLLSISLTVPLAILSYRIIEAPALQLKQLDPRKLNSELVAYCKSVREYLSRVLEPRKFYWRRS